MNAMVGDGCGFWYTRLEIYEECFRSNELGLCIRCIRWHASVTHVSVCTENANQICPCENILCELSRGHIFMHWFVQMGLKSALWVHRIVTISSWRIDFLLRYFTCVHAFLHSANIWARHERQPAYIQCLMDNVWIKKWRAHAAWFHSLLRSGCNVLASTTSCHTVAGITDRFVIIFPFWLQR